jgi:uncharacterized protein (DUF362 family)
MRRGTDQPPRRVSIGRARKIAYPRGAPYHPQERYPEYPFQSALSEENFAYEAVRESLRLMNLDAENAGTGAWNPLRGVVPPGGRVVIKPNLVRHCHDKLKETDCLLTHGSVIRAICDYVVIALGNRGKITIADTPIDTGDFDQICQLAGLLEIADFIRNTTQIDVQLLDLRTEQLITDDLLTVRKSISLPGDPEGYAIIDFKGSSALHELDGPETNYYTLGDHTVSHLDPNERGRGQPNAHHNQETHQYKVGKTILEADTVISAAKLKTHRKGGVTLNMKNMIGIICGKEYIPHHRPGSPQDGGDAYPQQPPPGYVRRRLLRKKVGSLLSGHARLYDLVRFGIMERIYRVMPRKEHVDWGDWPGNDTIWRTTVDINRALLYADADGVLQPEPQRSYFAIIDGIVGMDGEGPTGGNPRSAGLVIAGDDPVACDAVAARIMGFDPGKLRVLERADQPTSHALASSDLSEVSIFDEGGERDLNLHFEPARGWRGAIERKD